MSHEICGMDHNVTETKRSHFRFHKILGFQQICLWLLLKYSHFIFARQITCSTHDDDDKNDEKNDDDDNDENDKLV